MRFCTQYELPCMECGEPIDGEVFHMGTGNVVCAACAIRELVEKRGLEEIEALEQVKDDVGTTVYDSVEEYLSENYNNHLLACERDREEECFC